MHHSRSINFNVGAIGLKKELIRHYKWLHAQEQNEMIKNRISVTMMIMDAIEKYEDILKNLYPELNYPEWMR